MTENKAIDDLLKPRYKVIAGYPVSRFTIGEVVELTDGYYFDILDDRWSQSVFDKYPNIFKKLEWWEERQISEMPEYVRLYVPLPERYRFAKVSSWELFKQRRAIMHIDGHRQEVSYGDIPATEADYQKQQGHEK